MDYRRFGDRYVLRIDRGEEVLEQVEKLCRAEGIAVGYAVGLGATDEVTLGLFNTEEKVYHKTTLTGPMEITSLIGNISTMDGETYLHFHINVCNGQMQVLGGHLNACRVSATCEITLTKIEGTVERRFSDDVGLNLYEFVSGQ